MHVGPLPQFLEHGRFARRVDAQDEQLLGFVHAVERIVDQLLVLEHFSESRSERAMFRRVSFQADVDEAGNDVGFGQIRDRHYAPPATRQPAEEQHEQREQGDGGALQQRRPRGQRGQADRHSRTLLRSVPPDSNIRTETGPDFT